MQKQSNQKRIYVGDIIETNERFLPVDRDGVVVELPRHLKGIVVSVARESCGIRFGKGLSFTNYLNGLLSHPYGYTLNKDEFDVVEE